MLSFYLFGCKVTCFSDKFMPDSSLSFLIKSKKSACLFARCLHTALHYFRFIVLLPDDKKRNICYMQNIAYLCRNPRLPKSKNNTVNALRMPSLSKKIHLVAKNSRKCVQLQIFTNQAITAFLNLMCNENHMKNGHFRTKNGMFFT